VTAIAPVPGRETGREGEGEAGPDDHDVVVLPEALGSTTVRRAEPGLTATKTVSVNSGDMADAMVDLTFHRPKSPATDPAGQASWVLGLALALLSEGAAERVAMAEVLAEAAGRSRAIEGAYGRAVALLSEYPGDPLVHRTVDLLAKALLRSRRPARSPEEA
jgi:hypothetical protein